MNSSTLGPSFSGKYLQWQTNDGRNAPMNVSTPELGNYTYTPFNDAFFVSCLTQSGIFRRVRLQSANIPAEFLVSDASDLQREPFEGEKSFEGDQPRQ